MYVVDTNIFLEILLKQNKSEECKRFLDKNILEGEKLKLSVRSRPALVRCNRVRLCGAIPSKYHILVTILLYPGLGQGSELSVQQDEKTIKSILLSCQR